MRAYDYVLIIATIAILSALGFISFGGSIYAWIAAGGSAGWTDTAVYSAYLIAMNRASAPFFVALALTLVLCIPKRVVARRSLVVVTLAIFAAGLLVVPFMGIQSGLGAVLVATMAVQGGVIALTVAGSKRLRFKTEGFFSQLGSALLHLGLVIFLYDVMLLRQASVLHSIAFWSSTAIITVGMIFSFYQRELSRLIPRVTTKA